MAETTGAIAIPIRGGRIEAFRLPTSETARGTPLMVLGGVETGLRQLAGTEQVLLRRWEARAAARPVVVLGRPLADDPSQVEHVMHPRVIADAAAAAIGWLAANGGPQPPFAIEAESGGGRISLWLTVDHPELVSRLVLTSVASETPADSPMAERMGKWIEMAEADDWGSFFSNMAAVMRPASGGVAPSFDAAARLQPRPATAERFIGELTRHAGPELVRDRSPARDRGANAGAGRRARPGREAASSQLVAERIPGARLVTDADCGHTVRTSMAGYDETVEAFLAEGDPS